MAVKKKRETETITPIATALERLKQTAPDGPPFLGLMLDLPTIHCLALGQCNARAEVAARKALADYAAE